VRRFADEDFIKTCKTAFLDKTGKAVHCVMCGGDFKVARKQCHDPECRGNVIGDNDDDYVGKCHVCGDDGS
jgi:hypothetical protein